MLRTDAIVIDVYYMVAPAQPEELTSKNNMSYVISLKLQIVKKKKKKKT